MNWQTIREQYPNCWIVIEALDAYSQNGQRITPTLAVVAAFGDDWHPAWEMYKQVHRADRWREYYMVHTGRVALEIGIIDDFGRIVPQT